MKRIIALLAVTALMVAVMAMPAMAQNNRPVQVNAGNLISVLNNPNVNLQNVEVRVVNVEDSLNNNTVNVRALNNILNNSVNDNNVQVLNNFLNNSTIDIADVVDVIVVGNTLVLVVDVA